MRGTAGRNERVEKFLLVDIGDGCRQANPWRLSVVGSPSSVQSKALGATCESQHKRQRHNVKQPNATDHVQGTAERG
eukprot:2549769-Rhodomonas_salina.1